VDPAAEAVEVWTFGGESGTGAAREPSVERFRGNVPVRLEGQTVGEVDLAEVFKED
jgi:hypothetical protein